MSKLTQYGHAFQIKALAILITDRDFLQQIADIVSPDYFDNDAGKWVIRKTLKYYNEYKTIPTMEVFKVEIEGIHQELQSVAVKDLLKQAYKASKATDLNYVKDAFLDFCKNQTLKNALMKSVDLLELGDYDDIRSLIDRALKAGTERDIGHEYVTELEDRFREEARNTVETPWPLINKLLCGGLGQGDLGMIAGGPGGGKSWALVALGAQAVKTGHTVIHYTLELNEKYVGRRYDACFTEIPVGEIVDFILENIQQDKQQ
jgi:replicative DNA helicase